MPKNRLLNIINLKHFMQFSVNVGYSLSSTCGTFGSGRLRFYVSDAEITFYVNKNGRFGQLQCSRFCFFLI